MNSSNTFLNRLLTLELIEPVNTFSYRKTKTKKTVYAPPPLIS